MFASNFIDQLADNAGIRRYSVLTGDYSWRTVYRNGMEQLIVDYTGAAHGDEVYSAKHVFCDGSSGFARPSWATKVLGEAYEARRHANFGWVVETLQYMIDTNV